MNLIELSKAHNWGLPIVCPKCSGALVLSENHKQLYCGNTNCKSYISGRLTKFTNTLEIKEFGTATVEKIAEKFDNVSCIYKDEVYDYLKTLDGYGERSIAKMRKEVAAHNEMTLAKFIAAFNIEDIGEKVAQKIIDNVGTTKLEGLIIADASEYIGDGVKEKTAQKLRDGLNALKDDMREVLKYVKIVDIEEPTQGNLGGKSFCFTGAASRPRKELQQMVKDNGGIVFDSCKKGLDYLVLADPNSTSTKAVKARKDGVNLISEEDFVKMCGGN